MNFIDQLPWPILIIACLLLGFAPFYPEPHIVEKIRMLFQGTLKKPLDIFDLCYHAAPFIILIVKIIRLNSNGTS